MQKTEEESIQEWDDQELIDSMINGLVVQKYPDFVQNDLSKGDKAITPEELN